MHINTEKIIIRSCFNPRYAKIEQTIVYVQIDTMFTIVIYYIKNTLFVCQAIGTGQNIQLTLFPASVLDVA